MRCRCGAVSAYLIAGCGDVGGRLAGVLAARGEIVYGLRRSMGPLPPGVRPLRADLTALRLPALPRDITHLVYLPAPSLRNETAYRALFIEGLERLVTALPRLERLLFVSSSAVYGEHGGRWVDEDTPCAPLTFNGRVLLTAEAAVAALGLPMTIVRFSGLYGPGRMHLIKQIASGCVSTPPGAPVWTHRLHVEDAAAALNHLLHLQHAASCYLVTDDEPARLDVIYAWLANRLGVPPPAVGKATSERMVGAKRLCNARLRASGFVLRYPDFRCGYTSLLPSSLHRN